MTGQRTYTSDVAELRRIGEWLNARFPAPTDTDGDRVLDAAAEIACLRGRLADLEVSIAAFRQTVKDWEF